jgi:hypothetical protein
MAKIMQRKTAKAVELAAFSGVCKTKKLIVKGVDRMARIIWASQYGSEHFSKDQSGAGKLHLYLITSGT